MPGLVKSFRNAQQILKKNGGFVGTLYNIYKIDDFKFGKLVGEDNFGNKYYQNNYYFMGRSRWVEFSNSVGMDYDASQVPPDWHRWLQYISDETPLEAKLPKREWMAEHTQNFSGTNKEYVPYSTTRPKIEAWVPTKK